jgi:RND superfamily putative drug exporter
MRMISSDRSSTRLGRLARVCYSRRRVVLALWVLVLIDITLIAALAGSRFANKFGSGNSESARAQRILRQRFPAAAGDSAQVVFRTTEPIASPSNRADIAALAGSLEGLPHVSGVTSPFSPAARGQVSPDGHTAFAVVQFDRQSGDLPKAAIQTVIDRATAGRRPGLRVELGGPPSTWSCSRSRARAKASASGPRSSSSWSRSDPSSRWGCP